MRRTTRWTRTAGSIGVSLAAWCQLREGEILGLHVDDVDLSARILHVRRQVQALSGLGLVEQATKSDAGVRDIVIPHQVAGELWEHIDEWAGPEILVPRRADRREHLHPNTFRVRWERAAADAEMAGFVFHDLRHTGLTLYAQQGATAAELLHRGGHSSLEVALRYQHATVQRDRMLVDAIEDVII